MREAAAHKKLLREEAKSGLGRLDHDDQTVIFAVSYWSFRRPRV